MTVPDRKLSMPDSVDLFIYGSVNAQYKKVMRMLIFNLKEGKNAVIREKVLNRLVQDIFSRHCGHGKALWRRFFFACVHPQILTALSRGTADSPGFPFSRGSGTQASSRGAASERYHNQ